MSNDQYSKILNIAARLVTTVQLDEDLKEWIVIFKMPMKQRKHILKKTTEHNAKLKSLAIELRDAIQNK